MTPEEIKNLIRSADALERIADALEQMAGDGKPFAPDYKRHLSEYPGFDWASINAEIAGEDESGPTALVWRGNTYTRRSSPGDKKYGPSIWYSRGLGGSEYLTLVTFKEYSEAEPLPANIRHLKQSPAPKKAEPAPQPTRSALSEKAQAAVETPKNTRTDAPRSSTELQSWFIGKTSEFAGRKISTPKKTLLPMLMQNCFIGEGDVIKKSLKVLKILTGYSDYNQVPDAQMIALWIWLDVPEKGPQEPSAKVRAEAHLVLEDALATEAALEGA